MVDKYKSRFRPEVYLRFLNSQAIVTRFCWPKENDQQLDILLEYWSDGAKANAEAWGTCIEECLDKAIIATKFGGGYELRTKDIRIFQYA